MRLAILTAGPRGAGKTTYCHRIVSHQPNIHLISRDDVFIEIYGTTLFDPYSGPPLKGLEVMWSRVEGSLQRTDSITILDCWNGFNGDRQYMAEKLRELGADRVIIWYFITPLECCLRWFQAKPRSEGGETDNGQLRPGRRRDLASDFRLYHSKIVPDFLEEYFDSTIRINTAQLDLFLDPSAL